LCAFFSISTLFFLFIVDIDFEKYLYKLIYVFNTFSDISSLEILDIENIINVLSQVPEDSVAARLLEVMNIIYTSGSNYLGIKVESGTIGAILAHSTIATLSLKYGINSIIFLVLILLNPINRTSKDSLSKNNNILVLLPVFILSFDNQGDFITTLFLGFAFRGVKDYFSKIISSEKNIYNSVT